MDLKKFLEDNPIINTAQLAKEMWPENKSSRSKLSNKLNENIVGSGKQRVTEKDIEDAKRVLKKLSDNIDKL
ncbi:hypothetical protein [Chryseobacterium sp.]|uniref:hypothetical protein n=1 Tax=Chryseobacterium sp. TaxID=1871047 RepID=UPI0024E1B7E8|nr:hypothetical protein [Chryseobacterium sp.]